ncbi:MAG: GAF domain-containing protein, partial [Candidatus Aquicultor sp.]|nr:GAF domain-containing protein [Candidatus Aquicultor sp.]
MVVKEDRSVYLEDVANDPVGSQSEVVIALGIKSVAGTPLRYEGKVVGALTVGKTYASKIAAEDIALIGYMANQITTAIV